MSQKAKPPKADKPPIDVKTILQNGKPTYVIMAYEDYQRLNKRPGRKSKEILLLEDADSAQVDRLIDWPEGSKEKLAEIFTPPYMPAVESACAKYYNAPDKDKRPSLKDDGEALVGIAELSSMLHETLKSNPSAIKMLREHLTAFLENHNGGRFVIDIIDSLKILVRSCETTPAAQLVLFPQKGRREGTADKARRHLAYELWLIYKLAHGKPASRKRDRRISHDDGPLVKAGEILAPILGTGTMERFFREIDHMYKQTLLDNK